MIIKNDVGKRISNLRKCLGYSQAEFAEKLNVSAQAVSKWETGLALPDKDVLLNISWITKTSINNILEGEDFIEGIFGIDRGLVLINKILVCLECKKPLRLNSELNDLLFSCENDHRYHVVDGVVDFRSREIPGEQWSLSYRNYDEYLREQHSPGNPNYKRGLNPDDVIWTEIEKLRPRVILDMACGTGQGIKHQIKRINWPVTVIMVDVSHRILKWDKVFYSTEWKNPYVEMVYLACDGANLPISNDSIDMVFSRAGFESMQAKMMDGFREAFRVLKSGGHAVYTKCAVEDHTSTNSKSWMNLLFSSLKEDEKLWMKKELLDVNRWIQICKDTGFIENNNVKIYGELPVPDTDKFPFENEIAQWMAEYVLNSRKP